MCLGADTLETHMISIINVAPDALLRYAASVIYFLKNDKIRVSVFVSRFNVMILLSE